MKNAYATAYRIKTEYQSKEKSTIKKQAHMLSTGIKFKSSTNQNRIKTEVSPESQDFQQNVFIKNSIKRYPKVTHTSFQNYQENKALFSKSVYEEKKSNIRYNKSPRKTQKEIFREKLQNFVFKPQKIYPPQQKNKHFNLENDKEKDTKMQTMSNMKAESDLKMKKMNIAALQSLSLETNPALSLQKKSIEEEQKKEAKNEVHENEKKIILRKRSKTIVRNLHINAQSLFQNSHQQKETLISRTIDIKQLERTNRMKKTLDQIDCYHEVQVKKDTQEKIIKKDTEEKLIKKDSPEEKPIRNESRKESLNQPLTNRFRNVSQSLSPEGFTSEMAEKQYKGMTSTQFEQEINNVTHQFLNDWSKMHKTKDKVYEKLRNKFVHEYPQMKKYYTEYKIPNEEDINQNNNNGSEVSIPQGFTKQLELSKGDSKFMSFQNIYVSNISFADRPSTILSKSQIKARQDRLEKVRQKKMLDKIFKQAFFWSRTKKKPILNSILEEDQMNEIKIIKKIQNNLTFLNYNKNKEGKILLYNKNSIRGNNIIKNKQKILTLEKDGTKQQELLKKCLEDAIEDCIRKIET